ncbi:MAG: hypothetical protein E6G76_20495 [Alphaproteobacteria bacterium]|nr:MAG: hypothetical protein E6G76_20495 [Alphaproteobacteria bacterium]
MAGLVPAIHVLAHREMKTWMPGTRPGMTNEQLWRAAGTRPAASQLNPIGSFRFLMGVCRSVAVRAE